ncbi:hypothetical protein F4805DRAFT_443284 [Annulohypoxylon moriforme]|nr:hypothetical protein F4805DRAFT_443284 [Annulohypoxylon moriforme]
MATIDYLKHALRQKAAKTGSSPEQPLSDTEYSAGYDILSQGSESTTYHNFIIPRLIQLLDPLCKWNRKISVLEIGPGPKSIVGLLPTHMRKKIGRYAAFEPNTLFATRLEEWLRSTSGIESPMPCLALPPKIYRMSFMHTWQQQCPLERVAGFDVVLFCHSMYGMKSRRNYIEEALRFCDLNRGIVAVFHRDVNLYFDGLVCHCTASFSTGTISVEDNDEVLDSFAPFIAGFTMKDVDVDKAIRVEWRKLCRDLGRREETHPNRLLFGSPNIMIVFNKQATALAKLAALVPLEDGGNGVKNREARLHRPAAIVRPTSIQHVQRCVKWALKHELSLTVVGGGHSGHCLLSNVVAINMVDFTELHVWEGKDEGKCGSGSGPLIIAAAGCRTKEIVRKAMTMGLTVPLGSRPTVGSGLWLQGGIGHLARQHGLSCDAIVGALMVSVESGQTLCVGQVPNKFQPSESVRPNNEAEILWAIKGAGTNLGIVLGVVFKAYADPTYAVRNWVSPTGDRNQSRLQLSDFDNTAKKLPRNSSIDAFLYWDADLMQLGVTTFRPSGVPSQTLSFAELGSRVVNDFKSVDSVRLFDTEMYVSQMHGGHGGGKTTSFKRCLFLKHIAAVDIIDKLVTAIQTRPSPLCYLHLIQGGGAISDVAADATAFGCRDWDFACVITGVWSRDQDGTKTAQATVRWVYDVVKELMPLSSGVYSADLGPDPRDAALAAKAFGPNLQRLARLKASLDPQNVLAYACPLLATPAANKFIILVTGENCAGKDYCAGIWASVIIACTQKNLTARVISISDATKREYASATGADLDRLLRDRSYKEQHRPALTAFYQDQARQRPQLPEEHFLNVVQNAGDIDVLLITGMRDEAPVPTFSPLVPDRKLLEVRVKASKETQQTQQGRYGGDCDDEMKDNEVNEDSSNDGSNSTAFDYQPSLVFGDYKPGDEEAEKFAKKHLLPFFDEDLQSLAAMIPLVPDFPSPGIKFRHVLNIAQRSGGLDLCASLMQSDFTGDWAKVGAVVCCEAGGFVFATALAERVELPLALIRKAGKLPPPTISVIKPSSHISSLETTDLREERIEMSRDAIPKGAPVVVVDDVLATGETLCAVLQLLVEAGIGAKDISVVTVAEFPAHRGREMLYRRGFGGIDVKSLLIFGGV